MASFLGRVLFGWDLDKVQHGITQNTGGIANLSSMVKQTAQNTEALAGQFTNLSQNVTTQVAGVSDATARVAGKTEELVGNIAELRGEFKDLLDNVDELGGGLEEISEAILETADKMDGLTDALKNLEEVGKATEGAEKLSTAGIAGIVVASVMVVLFATFIACLVYQGRKAEKERQQEKRNALGLMDDKRRVSQSDTEVTDLLDSAEPVVGDLISLSDTKSEKGSTAGQEDRTSSFSTQQSLDKTRTDLNGIKEPYQMHNSTTTFLVPVNA